MRRKKRACRAVVIDLRKILKKAAVLFAVSAFLCFGILKTVKMSSLPQNAETEVLLENQQDKTEQKEEAEEAIKEKKSFTDLLKGALQLVTGINPDDLFSIIEYEFPAIGAYAANGKENINSDGLLPAYNPEGADTKETVPSPDKNDGGRHPIKSVDTSQAKNLSGTGKKILIKNETGYSVDIGTMLEAPLPFTFNKGEPEVLILHTHATESYTPEGTEYYDNSKSDRTQDLTKNVVRIGECMAEIFRENGIVTLHDTTLHDYPNYNGSYGNSLKTGESYLKKYPSIKMIIDVHRDAIVYGDGTKAKVVCDIDGKKAAQLMFVIGTNAGGLEHPGWKKNLQLSVKLQQAIENKYPGLMRGINLRKERFNEHLTNGSMILEVGTSGNTLKEAIYGAQCAAKVIADTLSEDNN